MYTTFNLPIIQPCFNPTFSTLNLRYDAFTIHPQNQKLIAGVRIYKQVYNIKIYWLNSILELFLQFSQPHLLLQASPL